MTNIEIINGLRMHQEWRKGNGGPGLSAQQVTAVIEAAIAALTFHPLPQEPAPEPPVVAEPPKPKAKK